jgi:hypothetical protein
VVEYLNLPEALNIDNVAVRNYLYKNGEIDLADRYHYLPEWCVVYDSREEVFPADYEDSEVKWMDQVDGILNEILDTDDPQLGIKLDQALDHKTGEPIPDLRIIDDELRDWIKRTILIVQRKNIESGLRPYTESEILFLTWEFWYADRLHYARKRGSGEPYSREHLFNSVLNAVVYSGVTDVSFLAAVLHHDDLEDIDHLHKEQKEGRMIENHSFDDILAFRFYKHRLDLPDEFPSIEQVQLDVFNMTKGVTKFKADDISKKNLEAINFRRYVDRIHKFGLLVALVRSVERLHNVRTLEGMVERDQKRGLDDTRLGALNKARDTMRRYAPTVYAAKWTDLYRELVVACYGFAHPNLLETFEEKQEACLMDAFSGEARTDQDLETAFNSSELKRCLRRIAEHPDVTYVALEPKSFADRDFVDPQKFHRYRPEGACVINDMSSMFRIVVLSKNDPHQDGEGDWTSVGQWAIRALASGVRSGVRRGTDSPNIWSFYKNKWGGRVEIKIANHQSDCLEARGVLCSKGRCDDGLVVNRQLPSIFRRALEAFLKQTHEGMPPETIYAIADDQLLEAGVTVCSPEEEIFELDAGATVIDFAHAVHTDLLLFTKAQVSKDGLSDYRAVPVSQALNSGSMVRLVRKDDEQPLINPSWAHFAKIPAARAVRSMLSSSPEPLQWELGADYLFKLQTLLSVDDKDLLALATSLSVPDWQKYMDLHPLRHALMKRLSFFDRRYVSSASSAKKDWEAVKAYVNQDEVRTKLVKDLGSCQSDPLSAVAEYLDPTEGFEFEIVMPHSTGSLGQLLAEEFPNPKVNLKITRQQEEVGTNVNSRAKVFLRFLPSLGRHVSSLDLLRHALAISERYSVKLVSGELKELLDFVSGEAQE